MWQYPRTTPYGLRGVGGPVRLLTRVDVVGVTGVERPQDQEVGGVSTKIGGVPEGPSAVTPGRYQPPEEEQERRGVPSPV